MLLRSKYTLLGACIFTGSSGHTYMYHYHLHIGCTVLMIYVLFNFIFSQSVPVPVPVSVHQAAYKNKRGIKTSGSEVHTVQHCVHILWQIHH